MKSLKWVLYVLFLLSPSTALFAQKTSDKLSKLVAKIEQVAVKHPDSLEFYAIKGIELAQKENQQQLLVRFKHLLGVEAFKEADYKKAAQYYLDAFRIAEKLKPSKEFVHVLFDASELYRRINVDTSMNFVRKGLLYAQQLGEQNFIADGYNRLGYAFEIRNQNDSAIYNYDKGLKLNQELGNNLGLSYAFESVAGILNKQNKHQQALINLQKSYQLRLAIKDEFAQSISLINIGETFKKLKQIDSAVSYARKAVSLSKKINFNDLLVYSYQFLSSSYQEKGDLKKALQYKDLYIKTKDSVFTLDKNKQINELDKKYQTEKRLRQVKNLEQQHIINSLEIKQRNIWLILLLILIAAGGLITSFVFKRKKLEAKSILQAEIIKQQDISSRAVLDAEERERRRIAGDLHDGVGQMLSVAIMNINLLFAKLKLTDTKKVEADKILSLVTESYDEMRSISHQMIPNALLKVGLASAVKEFVSKLNNEQMKVTLDVVGLNKKLDDQVETVIYRIIQESVNNVVKHAQANRLDIQLICDHEGIDLTIEDNGKGFDKSKVNLKDGIGLGNIVTRVNYLKGTIDIESEVGNGTILIIHLPKN